MSFKFPDTTSEQQECRKKALTIALENLFNTGYRLNKSSCLIFVPINFMYFQMVIAMGKEFRNQPLLKGMRFRVDLWERMREI